VSLFPHTLPALLYQLIDGRHKFLPLFVVFIEFVVFVVLKSYEPDKADKPKKLNKLFTARRALEPGRKKTILLAPAFFHVNHFSPLFSRLGHLIRLTCF